MPPIRNIGAPKEPINLKTVNRLLTYIFKGHVFALLFIFICIITVSFIDVYAQLFLKSLIDDYITPLINAPVKDFIPLIHALSFIAILYLTSMVANYLSNFVMAGVSHGVLKTIRDDMFSTMQRLPIKFFDDNSHGDIMSRYTNDTDALRQMISQSIPNALGSIIAIIAALISMIILSFPLTIIVIVSMMLVMILSSSIAKRSGKYFVASQNSLGKVNGFVEEMIDGTKVIKVFTHEEVSKKDFDKVNDELCNNSTKANIYANILMPMMANLSNLIYIIIAIIGGIISIYNPFGIVISLGTIIAFLTLTRNFTRPISRVSQEINSILIALSGATRIFNLMDEKEEENNGEIRLVNVKKDGDIYVEVDEKTDIWAWKDPDGKFTLLKGDVRFNDVSFGYTKDKEVLHNISLYAKPGQKIAFVGSTGAGKTTIINLINEFYTVEKGMITYDGIDIRKINKKDLRKSLGMVLQDTILFTGTVLDNIRYGTDATDEECINAAKLANADSFIRLLPDGYNTVLSSNGSSLSQGQRQLLAIARCALVDPPVMILDEATSSIDTRTEKIVQDGMDKLMEGRTVFVIAHRLSTIQNAKAIIVLENGRIIERGNHEDLLKLKGEYYELYTGGLELD